MGSYSMGIKFQLGKVNPVLESMVLHSKQYCVIPVTICQKGRSQVNPFYNSNSTATTKHRGTWKLSEVLGMSVTLTVVIVSPVCAYVQTHQIAYIKYVHLLISIIPQKTLFKKQSTLSNLKKNPQPYSWPFHSASTLRASHEPGNMIVTGNMKYVPMFSCISYSAF